MLAREGIKVFSNIFEYSDFLKVRPYFLQEKYVLKMHISGAYELAERWH